MNPSQFICQTHQMPYDSSKYSGCVACNFKQCLKCGKYNIKHDSQYTSCYTCNISDKQPCKNCNTNLVKKPFFYCYTCNQTRQPSEQKVLPNLHPPPQQSLEPDPILQPPPPPTYIPLYQRFPMKFYHQ